MPKKMKQFKELSAKDAAEYEQAAYCGERDPKREKERKGPPTSVFSPPATIGGLKSAKPQNYKRH